jgi:methyl-accepting chemotaxis protein
MDKSTKSLLTDEEISKALDTLNQFSAGSDTLEKSTDIELSELDRQIAELQAKKDLKLQKSVDNDIKPEPTAQVDAIVKAVADELSSKFEAFANVSKSILDSHEALNEGNLEAVKKSDELSKAVIAINESLETFKESLGTLQKSVQEIADSPVGKLASFKSVKGVERFAENRNDGKETLSLSRDKRVILARLEKSLESEDGQRRLGNVIGLIENGFANEENFRDIQKSLQNELGGDINITF